jgi:toxin FitB
VIVLDTNVVSELMRHPAEPNVVTWVDQQPTSDVYLTAITTAELLYGIARLPDGRRRETLADLVQQLVEEDFAGRILPFDGDAASHYAQIVTARETRGLPISMPDAQIAAICRLHSADLVTRNVKDFAHTGIQTVNPWEVIT